ncbi:hypothetical protein DICVIV_00953 [Dictyocaulus viviparus]|uniref:Uncharacterized protein n=1 Tax=Dictyocaulus viviparus TaxID=29172 RepID=A0A0D8Y9N0_DICVI|nr:hypothetical protein DICVIV_00953 [Dictyocaulus viviparus]
MGLFNLQKLLRNKRSIDQSVLSSKPAITVSPADQCIPKLEEEMRENEAYFNAVQQQVDLPNISAAYNVVLKKAEELCNVEQVERFKNLMKRYKSLEENIEEAEELCNVEQVERFKNLMKRYKSLEENIEEVAPNYSKEVRREVLKWLKEKDIVALSKFVIQESMDSLFDATKNSKIREISFQLASMQMDLAFNPI